MNISLRVFLFFLLSAGRAEFLGNGRVSPPKAVILYTDYMDDDDEKTRLFISKQNLVMKDLLKEDIKNLFAKMSDSLQQEVARIGDETEKSLQELSASFQQNLTSLTSKMEMAHVNITQQFTQKLLTAESQVDSSRKELSKTFNDTLLQGELKLQGNIKGLNETILRNYEELPNSVSDLTKSHSNTTVSPSSG